MKIIADTTPIHYLILIDEIEILRELFEQIIIPEAVFRELQHKRAPKKIQTWIASPPHWLLINAPSQSLHEIGHELGMGEREVIALAIELQADAVLIDDRRATREALKRNLPVLPTLSILAKAAEQERLDLVSAIHRLLKETNFYVAMDVVDRLLSRYRR